MVYPPIPFAGQPERPWNWPDHCHRIAKAFLTRQSYQIYTDLTVSTARRQVRQFPGAGVAGAGEPKRPPRAPSLVAPASRALFQKGKIELRADAAENLPGIDLHAAVGFPGKFPAGPAARPVLAKDKTPSGREHSSAANALVRALSGECWSLAWLESLTWLMLYDPLPASQLYASSRKPTTSDKTVRTRTLPVHFMLCTSGFQPDFAARQASSSTCGMRPG